MSILSRLRSRGTVAPALLGVLATVILLLSASPAAAQGYLKLNLVSKTAGQAIRTDPNLGGTWGITASATSPWWVSNKSTGTSTLYDGFGIIQPLVVTVPPKAGSTAPGSPTGIVFFNGTTDFMVSRASASASARFIFATLDGTISGWNPLINPTNAVIGLDRSAAGASYTGLAIGTGSDGHNYLFAANYAQGTVSVIDSTFHVDVLKTFTDPSVGVGFAPFGIQNINGKLYVTFAQKGFAFAPATGFVDVFNTSGTRIQRLVSNGALFAPWGLALAPPDFGVFSNALLVGNLGDGHINAFNASTGAFLGSLADPYGRAIVIPGLWGIGFGNDHSSGKANALYFASGQGIFGVIYARGVPLR